jgi:putative ABC transport system substrate-binding protein
MGLSGDPVASGLVASLARPGGNVTGLSLATTDTSSKWLELARIVAPKSQVGVLADPNQPTAQWHVKNIESAAQALGVKTPVAYTRGADQIEGSIASLAQAQVKTVIVLPGGLFDSNAAQLTLKHRMAAIGTTRFYAEKGALLSYGQSYGAFMRRAATYVDKIFKGAKPSELPVEQPAIFELVINMATAKQLGLTIPKELLFRADKVIE